MPLPEITALARRIGASRPESPIDQRTILAQLRELRDVLGRDQRPLARRLDAGVVLLENLDELGGVPVDVVFDVLARLVAGVERRLHGGPAPGVKLTTRGASPSAPEMRLDPPSELPVNADVMLGDLMKNLGMVTTTQLDTALAVQASLGLRIGDILVRIGAAPQADLERALEIQAQLRADAPRPALPCGPDPAAPA